jgi:hypothetical protein
MRFFPGHTTRRRLYCAARLALFALLAAAPVLAEDPDTITVRTEGRAEGSGVAARNAAVLLAERDAVLEVLKSLTADTALEPFQPILRNAAKYVLSYELLRSDPSDEATHVEIDAHVLERPLRQDVAAIMLPRLPAPPRIQLLIGERIGADRITAVPDAGVGETALLEALKRFKIECHGSSGLEAPYTQSQLIGIVEGDVDVGGRFARGTLADVTILGTAITESQGPVAKGDVIRVKAQVKLRIFRGSDGKMVDDLSSTAVVHGDNPALAGEQAVVDACNKLTADLLVTSVLAVVGARVSDAILVAIEQPGSKARYDAFLKALEAFPGVSRTEELFFSEALARLRFKYDGPMEPLAHYLAPGPYEGRELQLREAVAHEMHFAFAAPPSVSVRKH